MKTFLIALLTLAVSAPVLSNDEAGAKLELKFQEPEKFTDIRPANSTRGKFKERVQHNFEEVFQKMASELPAGYSCGLLKEYMHRPFVSATFYLIMKVRKW